jgi:hypothetical protein
MPIRLSRTMLAAVLIANFGPPARGQYTIDYGQLQPGGPPAAALPDLSRQLVAEARQLVPTVRAELSGIAPIPEPRVPCP